MKNNIFTRIADRIINTLFTKVPLSSIAPKEATEIEIKKLVQKVPELSPEEKQFIKLVKSNPERIETNIYAKQRKSKSRTTKSIFNEMPRKY